MSFTIFQESTTAKAEEFMENFYYCRTGDLVPRTGASLTANNAINNLGSDNYKFLDVYVKSISSYFSLTGAWELISEYEDYLPATTASFQITGINTYLDRIFKLIIYTSFSVAAGSSEHFYEYELATRNQSNQTLTSYLEIHCSSTSVTISTATPGTVGVSDLKIATAKNGSMSAYKKNSFSICYYYFNSLCSNISTTTIMAKGIARLVDTNTTSLQYTNSIRVDKYFALSTTISFILYGNNPATTTLQYTKLYYALYVSQ